YRIPGKAGGRSRPLSTKGYRPMSSAARFTDDSALAARLILLTSFCLPCGTNSAATLSYRRTKKLPRIVKIQNDPPSFRCLGLVRRKRRSRAQENLARTLCDVSPRTTEGSDYWRGKVRMDKRSV